jgi:predicted RNase H-like HicB family nuclease
MKYYFYAVLQKEEAYYNVSFPDLAGVHTFGKGIAEAVEMASDALGGHLIVMEDDNDNIPEASDFETLAKSLNDNEQLQLVTVETNVIRAKEDNRVVSKTVTLPNYLVELGKSKNVNFSQTLQRALREELGI